TRAQLPAAQKQIVVRAHVALRARSAVRWPAQPPRLPIRRRTASVSSLDANCDAGTVPLPLVAAKPDAGRRRNEMSSLWPFAEQYRCHSQNADQPPESAHVVPPANAFRADEFPAQSPTTTSQRLRLRGRPR